MGKTGAGHFQGLKNGVGNMVEKHSCGVLGARSCISEGSGEVLWATHEPGSCPAPWVVMESWNILTWKKPTGIKSNP